jgi:glycosyltransferase involved in cell wall biosynthesis
MSQAATTDRPMVTAIVPTYRRAHLLEQSIGSILRQTWRPLELIVVDDGSADNTRQTLAAFEPRAEALGIRYRYFEKEHGGPGLAKNFAMSRAEGHYFAFLDDDDVWLPRKVEVQISAMLANPEAGAAFTRYVYHGKPDQPKPLAEHMKDGWVFETLCSGETRAHNQTLMITREAFDQSGGFGALFTWEDTEFALRLSLIVPFLAVQQPLTIISPAPESMSREDGLEGDIRRDLEKLDLLDTIVERGRNHPKFSLHATNVLRARIYDEHVKHLLWMGRVEEAYVAWERALADCGRLPLLEKLKGKLRRARFAGHFGMKLRKPG